MCIYILTKALPRFILLLKIAYVELMVREMESCTFVTYIAKSNNGSMEMANHTSWSRLCACVEGGWRKWNTPFINLSPFYLDNIRTWLYYCIYSFFSWTFMCPIFFLHWDIHVSLFFWVMLLGHAIFFLDSPCFIWKILERERERSLIIEFYFVDGWNRVANFQCGSLAGGMHVILIKQLRNTSH